MKELRKKVLKINFRPPFAGVERISLETVKTVKLVLKKIQLISAKFVVFE